MFISNHDNFCFDLYAYVQFMVGYMDSIYSSMLLVPGVVALLNTHSITLRTTLWSQPSQLAKQPSDSHKMPKSMCSWRHLWRHYPCPWARVKRCWIAQHDCASLWWLSPRDRGGLAWIITWREGVRRGIGRPWRLATEAPCQSKSQRNMRCLFEGLFI